MCFRRYRSAAAIATAMPVLLPLLILLPQRQQQLEHVYSCLQAQRKWRSCQCCWFCFCFCFVLVFVAPHQWGRGVLPLPGHTALSVTMAVVLGAIVLRVETKMAPMTMTVTSTNEMHHGAPSTPPSYPCPREGKGEGAMTICTYVGKMGNHIL